MESPLNAREFLKRFHLPQLVRLSGDLIGEEPPATSWRREEEEEEEAAGSRAEARESAPNESLQSHWTYKAADLNGAQIEPQASDFRSLMLLANEEEEGEADLRCEETRESEFHSISAWSSAQVDEIIQQQQRWRRRRPNGDDLCARPAVVRVPRATLAGGQQTQTQRAGGCQAPFWAAELASKHCDREATTIGRDGDGNESQQARPSGGCNRRQLLESIRLTPPSCRPALSKLQLNQPFLLYKAHKKLELCAYVLDPKNELNGDKSGDPIYLPQSYPGKWSCN